jgi:hypothetical protein
MMIMTNKQAALEWLREVDHLSAVTVVDQQSLHPLPPGILPIYHYHP